MSENVAIEVLTPADALALSDLLAAYVTETKRGAPRRPDRLYVERLLKEPKLEGLGARVDGRLVGYALFFDLPEIASGKRMGQMDDLYVALGHRRKGVASRLFGALRSEGRKRGWAEIRWTVPYGSQTGRAFSARHGEVARSETFRVALEAEGAGAAE